jgi:hypothetical protein
MRKQPKCAVYISKETPEHKQPRRRSSGGKMNVLVEGGRWREVGCDDRGFVGD